MHIGKAITTAEFRTIGQLVGAADCVLVPVIIGRGLDSHGKPVPGLDAATLRALSDIEMAGQLAKKLLAEISQSEETGTQENPS